MKPCLWKKEKGLAFHEKDHSWLLYFFVCWLTIQCMCQINTFFQMIVCLFVWIKADFIFQIAVFQFYKCKKRSFYFEYQHSFMNSKNSELSIISFLKKYQLIFNVEKNNWSSSLHFYTVNTIKVIRTSKNS